MITQKGRMERMRKTALAVASAAVMILALLALPATAQGGDKWGLVNKYLGGIKFSGLPPLQATIAELPPEIKAVQVTIFGLTMQLGSLLKQGDIEISQLACENINIEDLVMTTTRVSETKIAVTIRLEELDLKCTGKLAYRNMQLFADWMPLISDGETQFAINKGRGSDGRRGAQFEFTTEFESPDFAKTTPKELVIQRCSFSMHKDMLTLDSTIATILIPIFQGTIEEVFCQIVGQMGVLKDGSPGFATRQLLNIYDLIENMSSYKKIDPLVVEAETMDSIRRDNFDVKDVLRLDSNILYSAASFLLNNVLGVVNASDPTDDILVNGMAREILYDDKGVFRLDGLDLELSADTDFASAAPRQLRFRQRH